MVGSNNKEISLWNKIIEFELLGDLENSVHQQKDSENSLALNNDEDLLENLSLAIKINS